MELFQTTSFLLFSFSSETSCPRTIFELEKSSRIRTEINKVSKTYDLQDKVLWPGFVSMSTNGTVQLQLLKKRPGNWSEAAKLHDDFPKEKPFTLKVRRYYWPVKVLSSKILNPTVCEIVVQHKEKVFHYIHPGHYVLIHLKIKGRRSKVPYYPTIKLPFHNVTYPNHNPIDFHPTKDKLTILVNDYGRKESLQYKICNKRPLNNTLYLSSPKGGFCLSFMQGINKIQFFCESIGIGPVLSVVLYTLQTNPYADIKIYYFNRDEEDIIYKEHMDHIAKTDKRFQIQYILKNVDEEWKGLHGDMKIPFLRQILDPYTPGDNIYSITAGHRSYVFKIATWLIEEMGYPKNAVYRFMTL